MITRQITLPTPTNDQKTINQYAQNLLDQNWNKKDLIRLIGIGVANFQEPEKQLNLWDNRDYKKMANLEAALYKVKTKFGENAIYTGSNLKDNKTKS